MRRTCTILLPLAMTFSVQASSLEHLRSWDPLGTQVMATGDLDGDGKAELVVASASRQEALILGLANTQPGYVVRNRYRSDQIDIGRPHDTLTAVRLLDLDQDGSDELCMIWNADLLMVVDPGNQRVVRSSPIPTSSDLALADLDGDGIPELVTLWGGSLRILDPETLQQLDTVFLPESGASALFAGDLIGDGRDEIILDNGWIHQFSRAGSDYSLEASIPFSDEQTLHIVVTDVDGDGHNEMASAGLYAGLVLHRFHPAPATTELIAPNYLTHAEWIDINDDGVVDAVVSLGANETRAVDLASGATLWTDLRSSNSSFASAGRFASSGEILLAYATASSLVFETMPPAPVEVVRTAPERFPIAVAATGSSEDRRLSILSGEGYVDQWSIPALVDAHTSVPLQDPDPPTWPFSDVFAGILPAPAGTSGETMIIVGGRVSADSPDAQGKLWFRDASANHVRTVTTAGNFFLASPLIADVMTEPGDEIVANARSYSADTDSVVVLDPVNGSILWQSAPVSLVHERGPDLALADLDGDGRLDIAMRAGDSVRVYSPQDGVTPVTEYQNVWSMTILEGTSPGTAADLILHHSDGTLARYSLLAGSASASIPGVEVSNSITAFRQAPDPAPLVAVNGTYALDVLSFGSTKPAYSVPFHTGGVQITAADLGSDNRMDLLVYGPGLSVYRVPNDYVFRNGFGQAED